MQNKIRVVVDAMGGDNAPVEPIKAAAEAAKEFPEVEIILVGKEDVIKGELSKCQYPEDRIRIVHAEEVI